MKQQLVILALCALFPVQASALDKSAKKHPQPQQTASAAFGKPVSSTELSALPEIREEERENVFDEIYDFMKRSGQSIAEDVDDFDLTLPKLDWEASTGKPKETFGTELATKEPAPLLNKPAKQSEHQSAVTATEPVAVKKDGGEEPDLVDRVSRFFDF